MSEAISRLSTEDVQKDVKLRQDMSRLYSMALNFLVAELGMNIDEADLISKYGVVGVFGEDAQAVYDHDQQVREREQFVLNQINNRSESGFEAFVMGLPERAPINNEPEVKVPQQFIEFIDALDLDDL